MLGPCALAARISVQGSVWRMRWDRAPLPGGLNKDGSVGSPSPMPALVLGPARGRIGAESSPRPPDGRTGDCAPSRPVALRLARPLLARDGGGASPSAGSRPTLPAPHASHAQPSRSAVSRSPRPAPAGPGPGSDMAPGLSATASPGDRNACFEPAKGDQQSPRAGPDGFAKICARRFVSNATWRTGLLSRLGEAQTNTDKFAVFDPAHTWKLYIYI